MKKITFFALALAALTMFAGESFASIKYVNGYTRSNGSYVSGHYKDTSGDGNPYNNANYLGYNRW